MFEQRENEIGYILYYNKTSGVLQKEDPELINVLDKIQENYRNIKYHIYRSAQKLYELQNALKTVQIPYSMVTSILEHHRLTQVDTTPLIKPMQLTSIIFDIYYAADKFGFFSEFKDFKLQSTSSMLVNLIWNIFDPYRNTSISLLELKQLLLLFCDTLSFEEIIFEHFLLLADHNRCISRLRFESMLKIWTKILNYLDENHIYENSKIPNIVQQCYESCEGMMGLNEYQFSCIWASSENGFEKFTNVINLTRRLRESQNIFHKNVKCLSCQTQSIKGLRFKCVRCKNLSLCLTCFSSGFTTKKHDNTHRMYEISSMNERSNRLGILFSKFCNLFTFSTSTSQSTNQAETIIMDNANVTGNLNKENDFEMKSATIRSRGPFRKSIFELSSTSSGFRNNSRLMERLLTIIEVLTKQNEILKNNMKSSEILKFVEEHTKILSEQIDELKEIHMRSNSLCLPKSSTPLRKPESSVKIAEQISSPLSRSIQGAEINKTFVEKNRPVDMSIRDISSWFSTRRSLSGAQSKIIEESSIDNFNVETQMNNFKFLLFKVKEIVEDSYSDNLELSRATFQLEKVLDEIIGDEEKKRH